MADGKEYWTSGGEQDSVRISEDVIASQLRHLRQRA